MSLSGNLSQKSFGSLSRANRTISNECKVISAVYTLQNWLSEKSSSNQQAKTLQHDQANHQNRARLLIYKAEESVLNFLFRWLLLDEPSSQIPTKSELQEERTRDNGGLNNISRAASLKLRAPRVIGRHKLSRSHSSIEISVSRDQQPTAPILNHIQALPDRKVSTIVRFIFWRWCTWANVIEAFLILILISLCIYQCYELLDDYFQYPTHVSITKALNDDFRADLPAVTICNNNQMSISTLKLKHPEYNVTHLVAISSGTFYSLTNYTLPKNVDRQLLANASMDELSSPSPSGRSSRLDKLNIDWYKVSKEFGKEMPSGMEDYLPTYDLLDTVTCANIWGEQFPCSNIRRVRSYQRGSACTTLFHHSTLWDQKDEAVQELEQTISSKQSSGTSVLNEFNDHLTGEPLFELDDRQLEAEQQNSLKDPQKVRIEMGNMEVLRLRINFQGEDYANRRTARGATFSVHAGSQMGYIDHITFNIIPGLWYSYYLERFDFRRLPAPYQSNCYNYEKNRLNWLEREAYVMANKLKILELVKSQAMNPDNLVSDYVDDVRKRSISSVS